MSKNTTNMHGVTNISASTSATAASWKPPPSLHASLLIILSALHSVRTTKSWQGQGKSFENSNTKWSMLSASNLFSQNK